MEIQSNNGELAIANMFFRRPFNNISIQRDGKTIKFNCVFGNRSRIFKSIENSERTGQYQLPMIIIERTGIQKNEQRLANVHNEVKYQTTSTAKPNYDLYAPVPVDITYQVTIVSKYQSDVDMCISNFLPFFNPDIWVQGPHPKFKDIRFKSQIVMENSITEDSPDEIDASSYDIHSATCTFTYKTYIFCGSNKRYSTNNVVRKLSVHVEYTPKYELSDGTMVSTMVSSEISSVIDTIYNGFIPQIHNVMVGFYPVDINQDELEQIEWVDANKTSADEQPFVDRFIWHIDENGLTSDYYT